MASDGCVCTYMSGFFERSVGFFGLVSMASDDCVGTSAGIFFRAFFFGLVSMVSACMHYFGLGVLTVSFLQVFGHHFCTYMPFSLR
jgi:hypothetical protein